MLTTTGASHDGARKKVSTGTFQQVRSLCLRILGGNFAHSSEVTVACMLYLGVKQPPEGSWSFKDRGMYQLSATEKTISNILIISIRIAIYIE